MRTERRVARPVHWCAPLLLAAMLSPLAACSGETDANGAGADGAGPDARAAERSAVQSESGALDEAEVASAFADAYESGFHSHGVEAGRRERRDSEVAEFDRGFADGFAALSSVRASGVDGFVASGEAQAGIDAAAERLSLPVEELPGANALLVIAGWEVVHDRQVTPQQAQAILAQVRGSLERNPPAAFLSNRDEWRLGRSYTLLAATLLREHAMRREAQAQQELRQQVAADFRQQTGLDLTAMSVGPEGFQ